MLRVLDLFSGKGGFSLGLERTGGFRAVAFCEINQFCRRVLAKHWPEVPCYEDVCTLTADRLRADGIIPDVVCGGFPCQDVSGNGRGAGLSGSRSGLWFEMLRLIKETRPSSVIIENVADLCARGLDVVLRGLAEIGYDAEWHCIPVSAIGGSHERDRVWIVAYPASGGRRINGYERGQVRDQEAGQPAIGGASVARWRGQIVGSEDIAWKAAANQFRRSQSRVGGEANALSTGLDGDRPVEPWEGNTQRLVDPGYPNRRPRLIANGNSVCPDIPELIGHAIMAAERAAI